MKVYVTTNGCEEAQISSAQVEEFFRANNSEIIRDSTQADLIIFFACGLTKSSEIDSLKVIGKLKDKIKPSGRLIVWGCLPKIDPQSLSGVYDGPIVGPMDVDFYEKILGAPRVLFDDISANTLIPKETFKIPRHSPVVRLTRSMKSLLDGSLGYARKDLWISRCLGRRIYWIRTSTGCTHHCTYCSDRCAWQNVRSRPMHKIISEFKQGMKMGYRRFFLISADLGAYGVDIGRTLPELLEKMVNGDTGTNYKFYLNQINPYHLRNSFHDFENIFESGRVGVLGSQVQSGSNRILRLMGRSYAAEDWVKCMRSVHNRFPNIFLLTHLLVGFPTETEEDFRMTSRLLDQVPLDYAVVFKFSRRQNVPASRLPGQVLPNIAEKRYNMLKLKTNLNIFNRTVQRYIWK